MPSALVSLWPPQDMHQLWVLPNLGYSSLAMAFVLSACAVQKERTLRQVSRMLSEERLLTTALSNQLHEISTLLDAGRAAATHDPLTGLANRVALEEGATGRDALLFLDLDGFKTVNDELGHGAGDEMLIAVARRIGQAVATSDLVARYGGDEFAVLLREVTEPAVARAVAARVLAAVSQPIVVDGRTAQVTGSVGLALPSPGTATPLATLLRQADKALYAAKADGKNCSRVYDPRETAQQCRVPAPRDLRSLSAQGS